VEVMGLEPTTSTLRT